MSDAHSSTVGGRVPHMGEHVVFVDPVGVRHDALVTQPWTATCVNLVFVTRDGSRRDGYGQQIERTTSLMHMSLVPVHGNYWRFPDEQGKTTEQ